MEGAATNYKRPRLGQRMLAVSLTTLMLTYQIRPSDCFGAVLQAPSKSLESSVRSISRIHFRDPTATAHTELCFDFRNDILRRTSSSSSSTRSLPIWLSADRSHLAEGNKRELMVFMRNNSFFTETETLKLLQAIEEASAGNDNLAAGAAEFCLLLAETMEMGLTALAAAAFHYCSCVKSLETNANFVNIPPIPSSTDYGVHMTDIVADAAKLKQLEMVAAKVMQEHGGRVTPDRRDAENLRHLLLTETKDWRSLAIRAGACLYRLRGILAAKQPLTAEAVRTAREALSIYAHLASRLGMHRLKNELEGAAFQILYSRQHKAVMNRSDSGNKEETMHQVLDNVRDDMRSLLDADPDFASEVEDFEVTSRVKEPYSLWKKMLRMGYTDVLQVPDALALRVILKAKKLSADEPALVTKARERALCYYVQEVCRNRWLPSPSNPRFKDYIKNPKTNGYQSLHYTAQTVWGNQPWSFEVQVRSAEMHFVAEFGIAAHWDYKASQKKVNNGSESIKVTLPDMDHSSDAYLRNLQKWHWQQHGGNMDASLASSVEPAMADVWQSKERSSRIRARTERLQPYLQALINAQSDLARNVFVFYTIDKSDGKVLCLPSGACVLDALRTAERTLGVPVPAATVNGEETTVTRQLQNGDILELFAATSTVAV
jgi:(p)ppGpp synthase/HD superfamily hydrolase